MKLTSLALAASLLTSPVNASDQCAIIKDEDTLTFYDTPAAHVLQILDSTKREMCFQFTPVVPTLTIEPDNLCVPIDEDNRQPLWLKFPSGAALDISVEYGSDNIRWLYDYKFKVCKGLLHARVS